MTLTRKIKKCKLALLGIKVKKIYDFPTCVTLGLGPGSRSTINGMCLELHRNDPDSQYWPYYIIPVVRTKFFFTTPVPYK
jgi:hypothetical protein